MGTKIPIDQHKRENLDSSGPWLLPLSKFYAIHGFRTTRSNAKSRNALRPEPRLIALLRKKAETRRIDQFADADRFGHILPGLPQLPITDSSALKIGHVNLRTSMQMSGVNIWSQLAGAVWCMMRSCCRF